MSRKVQILIDLDWDRGDLPVILARSVEIGSRLALIDHFLGIEPCMIKVRETAHGFHIYITAVTRHKHENTVTPELITALQLILMSDVHREIMNLRRILERRDNHMPLGEWNVLFTVKADSRGIKSYERKTELSDRVAQKISEGYETMLRTLLGEENDR